MSYQQQTRRPRISRSWFLTPIILSLILISAIRLSAQINSPRWTLEQSLERALKTSPTVHVALADEHIAMNQLDRAKAGQLPRVTFTGLLSPITNAEGDAVTGNTTKSKFGPYSFGKLEVIQPLYTFGLLRNEIQAARHGLTSKEAATAKARHAVIVAIKELYYNLLLSHQIKELLDESHGNFTTAVTQVEERLDADAGNVTEQDLLRLRIGVSRVAKERFTLHRAIEVARAALKRHLNLSPETAFTLAENRLKSVTLQLQPLDYYLTRVDKNRPEVAQLKAGVAARRARLQAARGAYYPSLFLAGGFEYAIAPGRDNQDSPFAKDFNFFSGPGIALGMRWQLDFWQTYANVAEREAELNKVKIQQHSATSGITLNIQHQYLRVQEFQDKLKTAQQARKSVRSLLVTTLSNFQLGVGEAKDIFESLGLYTQIVSDYYTTVRDFNMAAAKLTQATGQEVTTLHY